MSAPKKDRLTYYQARAAHQPERLSHKTTPLIEQLDALDFRLGTNIAALEQLTMKGKEPVNVVVFLQNKLSTYLPSQSENATQVPTDKEIFQASISTTRDLMLEIFRNLTLSKKEKELLRKAFFENAFGRAGLSILVDTCCTMLCEKMNVAPLHFAHSTHMPNTSTEALPYTHRRSYHALFQKIEHFFIPTRYVEAADGFTLCSFDKLSSSMIQKMMDLIGQIDFSSLVRSSETPADPDWRLAMGGTLLQGISLPGGLIYDLAERMCE
jgi:hypothetical protein